MKLLTVVQARMKSTRLPGKVLLPVLNRPILCWQIERIRRAQTVGTICIATSTDSSDDPIAALAVSSWAIENNVVLFRGSLEDCLDRHVNAALKYGATAIAKIPSDCPLISPQIIDLVFEKFSSEPQIYDYVSNLHPATYPDGNDVEIMTLEALQRAHTESDRAIDREHTTTYIWDNPAKFRLGNVTWEAGHDFSKTQRWTLDYPEDFNLIRSVYEALYPAKGFFDLNDILRFLESNSEIRGLNEKHLGQYWTDNYCNDLRTFKEGVVS